jgi:hypothetical protein
MFAVLELSDFALIAVLILLIGAMTVALKPRDKARLFRLEQKLDMLLQHAGIKVPQSSLPSAAAEALRNGDKIKAIKHYRDATGAGLAEAKNAVERAESSGQYLESEAVARVWKSRRHFGGSHLRALFVA